MIVWSGWGVLVALFAVAAVMVGALVERAVPGLKGYGMVAAPFLAALLTFGLAKGLSRKGDRVLLDPQTGQQVVLRRGDSLFFIPVRAWTYIFLAMGSVMLLTQVLK